MTEQNSELDLNTADENELARAFQVNREIARQIIQFREGMEGFKSWDDVKKIPGISHIVVENLRKAGATLGGKRAA